MLSSLYALVRNNLDGYRSFDFLKKVLLTLLISLSRFCSVVLPTFVTQRNVPNGNDIVAAACSTIGADEVIVLAALYLFCFFFCSFDEKTVLFVE